MSNPYLERTAKCAGPGCTNRRSASNHWWVIEVTGKSLGICPLTNLDDLEEKDFLIPVCGSECAAKIISQHMSGVNQL